MTDESVTPTPPRPLTVKAFGVTDRGKVRTINEDQFLIAELTKAMRVWQTSLPEPKLQVGEERAHLFLVADGMGGHRTGERSRRRRDRAVHAQFVQMVFRIRESGRGESARAVPSSDSTRRCPRYPSLRVEAHWDLPQQPGSTASESSLRPAQWRTATVAGRY